MIEWNERRLEELVRKMELKQDPESKQAPIHLSLYELNLYRSDRGSAPLMMQVMRRTPDEWTAWGYDETDQVSLVRYLGSLGCRADRALSEAAQHQHPLPLELAKALIDVGSRDKAALWYAACTPHPLILELAKLLIDAGAYGKNVLWAAARSQQPLTLELAKLLMDIGCDPTKQLPIGCDPVKHHDSGWDSLVCLAYSTIVWERHPADPQVTDLFLSCGCRTNLDGCKMITDAHRLSFDQILKEHAEWKKSLS